MVNFLMAMGPSRAATARDNTEGEGVTAVTTAPAFMMVLASSGFASTQRRTAPAVCWMS